eukprot:scaffold7724_cov248-Pinguiococcus_pyrenoidosus.AAC.6
MAASCSGAMAILSTSGLARRRRLGCGRGYADADADADADAAARKPPGLELMLRGAFSKSPPLPRSWRSAQRSDASAGMRSTCWMFSTRLGLGLGAMRDAWASLSF